MTETQNAGNCIFCRIALKTEPNSTLLYEDDELVIFKDIKPATKHHYLVVTKQHLKSAKSLNSSHLSLIERMIDTGKKYLTNINGEIGNTRMGFHWPPFTSISHIHMHILNPTTDLGFFGSLIFKPGSLWFVTADWLLDHLSKK